MKTYYVIKSVIHNYYWSEKTEDFGDFKSCSKYANKHTALIAGKSVIEPFTLVLVHDNI